MESGPDLIDIETTIECEPHERTIRCHQCGEFKPLSNYQKHGGRRKGYHPICHDCFYHIHKGRFLDEKQSAAECQKAYRASNPHYFWASSTISLHKRQGRVVNVTVKELEDIAKASKTCPICECKLTWEAKTKKGHALSTSPSWDRKFNGDRMTLQNTWIVCYHCNTMKSDMPLPELVEWCRMVVEKFGKPS